jgi:hypothetical protein
MRRAFWINVGFTPAIAAPERQEITTKLEALIKEPGFTKRAPGGPNRWSTREKDDWKPSSRSWW